MPADGVALRFIDVVDCLGSSQSNMEVAWVGVEKAQYLVSPDRKLLQANTHNRYRLLQENECFPNRYPHRRSLARTTTIQLYQIFCTVPSPSVRAAPPRRQTHVNQLQTREPELMQEDDEDDSCACCGSWNTYMGAYLGLHQKFDGCGDWLCQECTFLCPGCDRKTCEACIGYNLSRLPTASDDKNPEIFLIPRDF